MLTTTALVARHFYHRFYILYKEHLLCFLRRKPRERHVDAVDFIVHGALEMQGQPGTA